MIIKILLAGDGGQGIQTIANLLTAAAFSNDFYVSDIPNFGLEQRGGVSLAYLQISKEEITYPKFTKPDILLIMSDQALERTPQYQAVATKIFKLSDFEDKLKENDVLKQSYNIFFLGLLGSILEKEGFIKINKLHKFLEKKLGTKPGWVKNEKAFNLGIKNLMN